MDGDRMQVPAIESQRPTLVPPAPYSIPPLGYDVRPPKKGWDKERIGVVAFVMGTLVGALLIGAVRTAWLERLTGVTPPHVVQAAAAPPPACPEVPPPVVPVVTDPASPAVAAAPAPVADSAGATPPPAKAAPHRHHAVKPVTASALSNSKASDEAFMRAIRSSAH